MRKFLILTAVVAAASVLAGPAWTQQRGGASPDQMMKRMDRDRDGRLSRNEFRRSPQRFDMMDADRDGYVTSQELSAGMQGRGPGGRPQSPLADWYAKLPIILTHTHILAQVGEGRDRRNDWAGAFANAIRTMDENRVRAAILMPTPQHPDGMDNSMLSDLQRHAARYPGRFRVAGGGESLNGMINKYGPGNVTDRVRTRFIERAEAIAASGVVGFGETTALHLSFFRGHPFELSRPDHPLFRLLADQAAKHDIPLDLHVEAVVRRWPVAQAIHDFGGKNPDTLPENIAALERLLAHNRQAKIIWVHLGMDSTGHRSPELTRRMLQAHPNLYLSITGNWLITNQLNGPHWFIRPGTGLNPAWRSVLVEFSDRITIGSDSKFTPPNPRRQMRQLMAPAIRIVRMPFLPPAVARKIAYENAQRLFKLSFVGPNEAPLP